MVESATKMSAPHLPSTNWSIGQHWLEMRSPTIYAVRKVIEFDDPQDFFGQKMRVTVFCGIVATGRRD